MERSLVATRLKVRDWKRWIGAVALVFVASGCGDGLLAEGEEIVYLSPRSGAGVEAAPVVDELPEPDEQRAINYEQIRQGFAARPAVLLNDPDAPSMLSAIEQSFLLSGHYLELIALYEQVYAAEGTASMAAPALAWAYMQIGHEPGVRALVERMVEEQPEDPLTWLVAGNAHLAMGDMSLAAQQRALDSFERVLELDPGFERFIAMDRGRLDAQISSLRQQLPDDIPPEVLAEADEGTPMHHAGEGEGGMGLEVEAEDAEIDVEAAEEEETDEEAASEEAQVVAQEVAGGRAPAVAQAVEEVAALRDEEEPAEDEEIEEEVEEVDPLAAARKVAEGRRLMRQGSDHFTDAQEAFEEALEYEPENVDAAIGILQLAQRSEAPQDMLRNQVDTIAAHELSAQQAYDLGLFSLQRLNDRELASSLLERVRQKDPSFADRVDIDALLDD